MTFTIRDGSFKAQLNQQPVNQNILTVSVDVVGGHAALRPKSPPGANPNILLLEVVAAEPGTGETVEYRHVYGPGKITLEKVQLMDVNVDQDISIIS